MCDDGCIALFDKDRVSIIKDNAVICTGIRDRTTGLWLVDLLNPTGPVLPGPNILQYAANSAIAKETIGERIAFLHACAGSPVISTFCDAIDAGYYTTWPELTSKLVRKYVPQSAPMVLGHLNQQRKNLRSTKPKAEKPFQFTGHKEEAIDTKPIVAEPRCHFVYADCQPIEGQIYSDQPGQFLVASSSGNKYMMTVYDYDSNTILAEPMQRRTGAELTRAYGIIHKKLTDRGFKPRLQRLDNEASEQLKQFMSEEDIDFLEDSSRS